MRRSLASWTRLAPTNHNLASENVFLNSESDEKELKKVLLKSKHSNVCFLIFSQDIETWSIMPFNVIVKKAKIAQRKDRFLPFHNMKWLQNELTDSNKK